jgi:hypothetical protein
MVLVDRDGWEAERVQGGYRSAWQRNRDGKVSAVDLYSKVYDKENELIRAGMVHVFFSAASLGGRRNADIYTHYPVFVDLVTYSARDKCARLCRAAGSHAPERHRWC